MVALPGEEAREAEPARKILLVEDDLKLAALVGEFLDKNGYEVIPEHLGDRALAAIERHEPDMVILDLMLPGKDGLSICREARPAYRGPILMLTARGEDLDEILGLEVGADDYLTKPVRPRVLLARIRSLFRRIDVDTQPQLPSRLAVGALRISTAARTVHLRDELIALTSAEFDLLWVLASSAGRPMSREELSQATRGISYDGVDRAIDLRIASLRAKLGDNQKPPTLIKSVRGVGYQLAVE